VNKQSRRVLMGWMALSDSERQELDTEFDKFRRGDTSKRKDLREDVKKSDAMDLGPSGSGCPCCGR
jgi:hypothetical protein